MPWKRRVVGWASMCLVVLVCTPSLASAQRGRGHGGRPVVVRPVVVAGGFYSPYYYNPFFWDFYGWGPQYPPGFYGASFQQASAARIQVTPRNTEVYVDGFFAGVVDDFDGFAQRLRVATGQHVIELYLDGYRSISQSILFQPGETYRIRHAMEPVPAGEAPPPRPQPPVAPPVAMPPPPGPSDAPGRALGPAPLPPPADVPVQGAGEISVRVQPTDASILIDGERWEASGAGAPLRVQVTAGTHRVEVEKDGYQTFSTTVQVRPGEATPINVSLTPRP